MFGRKRILLGLLVLVLSMGLIFTGCGGGESPNDDPSNGSSASEKNLDTIKLGYVQWVCAEASVHLAQAVIMDKLGYEATVTSLEAGALFAAVADGSLDAHTTASLPLTHKDYMEQYGDQLDDYGRVYDDTRIGLVVPEYVDIDSIEELKDTAGKFENRIVGIDGGAGIMLATEQAIEDYDLDMELIESSDMAMTAALDDAYMKEEWIVVTGWTPHWKFAKYDLKFLDDPQKVYGDAQHIHVMARLGLEQDASDVASFLKNYHLEEGQLGAIIGAVADGAKPLDAARAWMAENEDTVEGWLQ